MSVNPITGRPFGKPGSRVRERMAQTDRAALQHFPTPELRAYFLAHNVETPACWPRVLDGTMTHERYRERSERMLVAILRSGGE